MDSFSQMQIFFLISSAGFIILFLLIAIFLFYLIRAMRAFSRISEKLERGADEIGDTAKELYEDVRDSVIFNFLFKKRRKRNKS